MGRPEPVAAATVLPRLRARLSPDALLAVGSIGLAAVTLLLAYARLTAVAAAALVVGGGLLGAGPVDAWARVVEFLLRLGRR